MKEPAHTRTTLRTAQVAAGIVLCCNWLALVAAHADPVLVRLTEATDPTNLFIFLNSPKQAFYNPITPEVFTTTNTDLAPESILGYSFTHWTLNGQRIEDLAGQSLNPVSASLTSNIAAVAHYVPSNSFTADTLVPDWYKIKFFNTTNIAADSLLGDDDGFDLATEFFRGYHPRLRDQVVEGGISRRRSGTTLVLVDTNYVRVTVESDPFGLYVTNPPPVLRGASFALPARPSSANYEFTGWFLGTNRVDDPRGFSSGTISVAVGNNTMFLAKFLPSGTDADRDGLSDGYEYYYFNGTNNSPSSNPSGDGFDIATDILRGYQPNVFNQVVEGGISRRRSGTLNYIPAPPVIISNPPSWSGPAGSNITITAAARGAPPWNYRWLLNGVTIPGATNESLTLSNVQPTDSGLYSVVIANLYGATWSDAAEILVDCPSLALADNLEDRIELDTASGLGRGSNANATHQADEPEFFQKFGSNSVWLAWRAADSGIATFQTRGSSIDTLLAAYVLIGQTESVSNLVLVVRDDDRGSFLTSRIQFNAVSNVVYYIGVDGYAGDKGSVILSWDLEITGSQLPVIVQQPESRVVRFGETNGFSVLAVSATPITYQWHVGGVPLPGATNNSLGLTNIGLAEVGNYMVQVSNTGASVNSEIAFLQINSTEPDGNAEQVAALEKLAEVIGLKPRRSFTAASSGASSFGFTSPAARGFSGSQFYSTVSNATDGTTAWFKITPQVTGPVLISTEGSQFDTYFKLYSGASNAIVMSQLSTQSFAYNKGIDFRTRRITFNALSNLTYYVQLDGGAQRGLVRLSWSQSYRSFIGMLPSTTPLSASFILQLTNFNARQVQWIFNEQLLRGQTNLTFTLPELASTGAGDCAIEITDASGRVWRDKFYLRVLPILFAPPKVEGTGVRLGFGTTYGRPVIVQASSDLQYWTSIHTNTAPGLTNQFTDPAGRADRRYFRFVLPP